MSSSAGVAWQREIALHRFPGHGGTNLNPPASGDSPSIASTPKTTGDATDPRARSGPFRGHLVREILVSLAISRLALVLVGWLAMNLLNNAVKPGAWELDRRGRVTMVQTRVSPNVYPLTNMWSRWDAGWYVGIAEHGYQFAPGQPSNRAFFPIYPMLMRVVRLFLQSHTAAAWLRAGIIVSNAALAVALAYLFALVKFEFDEATARRAVLYLLIFPTTFFLSAVYSESVFLAFTIASFYYARKRQWWLAGVVGCAAALSRPPGVMIALGLGAEYLLQCEFNWRKIRLNVLAVALPAIALAGFFGFLHYAEGAADTVVQAQSAWGLQLQPQWRTFAPFFQRGLEVRGTNIDLGFTLFFIALVIGTACRLRLSYAVFSIGYLLFITLWGSLESIPRYGLGLFPAIVLLAVIGRHETFHRAYLPISAALAAVFMAVFAVWGWVA